MKDGHIAILDRRTISERQLLQVGVFALLTKARELIHRY